MSSTGAGIAGWFCWLRFKELVKLFDNGNDSLIIVFDLCDLALGVEDECDEINEIGFTVLVVAIGEVNEPFGVEVVGVDALDACRDNFLCNFLCRSSCRSEEHTLNSSHRL